MKTTMKITALAVVTVLVALSCAPPDVTLTNRDLSEFRSADDAKYTDGLAHGIGFPTSMAYVAAAALVPADRELTITFPYDGNYTTNNATTGITADILNEPNDKIEAGLQEFLKLCTFTSTAPTGDLVDPPSTVGKEYTYKFVSRTVNSITIRLDEMPSETILVWKVIGSKYKINGQPLDNDNDGVGGEADYDDVYQEFAVFGAPTTVTRNFQDLVLNGLNLYVDIIDFAPATGPTKAAPTMYVLAATFNSGTQSQARTILGELKDKFSLEKYNKSNLKWEPVSGITFDVYKSDGSYTWGNLGTDDGIFFSVNTEDLTRYRVVMNGADNLKSKDNIGTKPAKIMVNGSFFNKSVVTSATPTVDWTDVTKPSDVANITDFLDTSSATFTSDRNGKNVVITVPFSGTFMSDDATPVALNPQKVDSANFIKNISLVYDTKNNDDGNPDRFFVTNSSKPIGDWAELKIDNVEFKDGTHDTLNDTVIRSLVITLDPANQLPGAIYIRLLANNNSFKFQTAAGATDKTRAFGDSTNDMITYKDTLYWKDYGAVLTLP